MSVPRQVIAGRRYLVTRRCTQRQFWLKPSSLTNQILAYCLAWAAQSTGVLVHAGCALGNHWHATVTDVEGRLPEFLHTFHLLVAKCVNASHGRWENLWASEAPSAVRLESDEDVLDKIVYTLTNPVAARLVREGARWPGLRTAPEAIAGSSEVIERPAVFFRPDGPMPETLTLEIVRPAIFADLSDRELAAKIADAVRAREAAIVAEVDGSGGRFAGAEVIARQKPSDSPNTIAPRRELRPRVASKNKWLRIEALLRLKEFLAAYRDAYLKWREGLRDTIFPHGTYALLRHHGVPVAGPA